MCLYEGWRPTIKISLEFYIYFTVVRSLIGPLFHSGRRPCHKLRTFILFLDTGRDYLAHWYALLKIENENAFNLRQF